MNKALLLIVVLCGHSGNAAAADYFDLPALGKWKCPDGHYGPKICQPPDFRGAYWDTCIPGRDDCVHSETAFRGYSNMREVQRGPGYCYTEQPYTCSPDGKVP